MSLLDHFGYWDGLLVVVVSLQATLLAYLYQPRWKALVLTLPIPFTVASLAVGRPIDATNVLALLLLLVFTHGVRLLHYRARVSIVLSIVLSALVYCVLGSILARRVPTGDGAFWASCLLMLLVALLLLVIHPHREESGHRSPLPIWIKLPLIALVVFFLILIKQQLHGFMTMFPMVGVVAAYEARHSLWTISRQIPVLTIVSVPMMMTCRLVQSHLGLGPGLAIGWCVFLLLLIPLTRRMWYNAGDLV